MSFRQAAGGSFSVTNEPDPAADNFPPGQVTDLKVTNLKVGDQAYMVKVEFTAPGDDLDSSDAAAEYVFKFSSTAGNLTGVEFDKNVFNTQITEDDLIDSDLVPVNGGTTKSFYIMSSVFIDNEKFMIAMKATDKKDNPSLVSNKAQVFIPGPTTTTEVGQLYQPNSLILLTAGTHNNHFRYQHYSCYHHYHSCYHFSCPSSSPVHRADLGPGGWGLCWLNACHILR